MLRDGDEIEVDATCDVCSHDFLARVTYDKEYTQVGCGSVGWSRCPRCGVGLKVQMFMSVSTTKYHPAMAGYAPDFVKKGVCDDLQ